MTWTKTKKLDSDLVSKYVFEKPDAVAGDNPDKARSSVGRGLPVIHTPK